MYYKDEIYYELGRVDKILKKNGLYLNLKIVGGAALIFNGINCIETHDIDTIERIEYEVKEILADCSIDINDDVLDYIENFNDSSFIYDEENNFENITIYYLDLYDVIKTKMKDTNPDKLESLYYLLLDEFEVEMSVEGIYDWFEENGIRIDKEDIENFLDNF